MQKTYNIITMTHSLTWEGHLTALRDFLRVNTGFDD